MSMETGFADLIKILSIHDRITCMNFGPFDNGYLLVGFDSGMMHVFDTLELNRVQSINLFSSPVKSISFEPTNLIFVGS